MFISGVRALPLSASYRLKVYKEKLGKEIKKYFLRTLLFPDMLRHMAIMSEVLVFPQLTLEKEHQKNSLEKFILSRNGSLRLVLSPHRGDGILHFTYEIFIEDCISVSKYFSLF